MFSKQFLKLQGWKLLSITAPKTIVNAVPAAEQGGHLHIWRVLLADVLFQDAGVDVRWFQSSINVVACEGRAGGSVSCEEDTKGLCFAGQKHNRTSAESKTDLRRSADPSV